MILSLATIDDGFTCHLFALLGLKLDLNLERLSLFG